MVPPIQDTVVVIDPSHNDNTPGTRRERGLIVNPYRGRGYRPTSRQPTISKYNIQI